MKKYEHIMKYLMIGGVHEVKTHQRYYRILITYMLGFILGILYTNFIASDYVTVTGIFHEYFLNQYTQDIIVTGEYLLYLLKSRGTPLLVFVFLSTTRIRKLVVVITLGWTGFLAGIISVASVLRLGASGILLCVVAAIPHIFFYVAAYIVLLWYFYNYPKVCWNYGKTLFVIISFLSGILLEAYMNPHIVKFFMNLLL